MKHKQYFSPDSFQKACRADEAVDRQLQTFFATFLRRRKPHWPTVQVEIHCICRTSHKWEVTVRCSAATAVLGTTQIVCLSNRKLWTQLQKRGTVNIAWHWVNRLFKVQGIKNMLTFHIELAQGATLSQCFFQHGCNMRAVGDINLNVEPIYPVIYRVFSSKCLIWCQRLNVAVFTQSIAIHSVWLYRGCGLEQSRTSEYELPQQTFLYSNARDSKWFS